MPNRRVKNILKGYKKASTKMVPIIKGIIVLAVVASFILVAILYTYKVECVNARKKTFKVK